MAARCQSSAGTPQKPLTRCSAGGEACTASTASRCVLYTQTLAIRLRTRASSSSSWPSVAASDPCLVYSCTRKVHVALQTAPRTSHLHSAGCPFLPTVASGVPSAKLGIHVQISLLGSWLVARRSWIVRWHRIPDRAKPTAPAAPSLKLEEPSISDTRSSCTWPASRRKRAAAPAQPPDVTLVLRRRDGSWMPAHGVSAVRRWFSTWPGRARQRACDQPTSQSEDADANRVEHPIATSSCNCKTKYIVNDRTAGWTDGFTGHWSLSLSLSLAILPLLALPVGLRSPRRMSWRAAARSGIRDA
ncbi:hypothetical protein C8Q80DRAFT_28284 [Daedaleopsis nitida]|nr:hypothetical protein C8Q80DRAFT_28284 [Daedaleopsis nitida]